jgi:hypothetical protein
MATNDIDPPWSGKSQEQIRAAARQLGHADFLSLINAHVGEPYGKVLRLLREKLGYMVPIMQVHRLHMQDAIAVGLEREAAKDSLVRTLREQVGKGWNRGSGSQEKRRRARAYWVLPYADAQDMVRINALADQVWEELKALNPPDDWCPVTPNDPLIEQAFSRGWPLSK